MLLLTSLIAILIALGTHRKYKTILLDPPWDINQKGKLGAINHYDLMRFGISPFRSWPQTMLTYGSGFLTALCRKPSSL